MSRKQAASHTLRHPGPLGRTMAAVPVPGTSKATISARRVGSGDRSTADPEGGNESSPNDEYAPVGRGNKPVIPYRRAMEVKLKRGIFLVGDCLGLILFIGVLSSGLLITALFILRVYYNHE